MDENVAHFKVIERFIFDRVVYCHARVIQDLHRSEIG